MKKNEKNLTLLTVFFCVALVISNVVTTRIVPFLGLTVAGGLFTYPITFLITDIVGEIWGKQEANRIVKYGLIGQLVATFLIIFTGLLPCVSAETDSAYKLLLGQNWIIVVGSLVAYYCSQSWDVYVFHKIRNKIIDKTGETTHRWIWNNASTMTSQIVDTVVFIGIAFGIGFGWLFDANMLPQLGAMMVGQYLLKLILALLDTPFFYLLTKKANKKE